MAVPHVLSSGVGVNKTTVYGRVFISVEIIVFAAQETKIALIELTKNLSAIRGEENLIPRRDSRKTGCDKRNCKKNAAMPL